MLIHQNHIFHGKIPRTLLDSGRVALKQVALISEGPYYRQPFTAKVLNRFPILLYVWPRQAVALSFSVNLLSQRLATVESSSSSNSASNLTLGVNVKPGSNIELLTYPDLVGLQDNLIQR